MDTLNEVIFYSTAHVVLFVLVILMLFGRTFAFAICKIKGHFLVDKKLGTFLRSQPWLPALLILADFAADYCLVRFNLLPFGSNVYIAATAGLKVARVILSLWLFWAEAKAFYIWLKAYAEGNQVFKSLLPDIKHSLRYVFLVLALPFITPNFLRYPHAEFIKDKVIAVLMIWAIASLLIQIMTTLEKVSVKRMGELTTQNFQARRVYTQIRVFKRVIIILITILAIAATAMTFENIREIGTSILASAGLAAAIIGFAAQKTLGNLFAGIQIAITQPIRINDTIVLENELGTVEEISLTHVVLRIWDLRRLIIPINYFIEKPFQNFTRTSTDLLCPIFFNADYNLPVEPVRQKFNEILKGSEFWDGKIAVLQVVEAQGNVMKLRALASVHDSGSSWNLKCEVLEKLIAFIVEQYPQSLPKLRNVNMMVEKDEFTS